MPRKNQIPRQFQSMGVVSHPSANSAVCFTSDRAGNVVWMSDWLQRHTSTGFPYTSLSVSDLAAPGSALHLQRFFSSAEPDPSFAIAVHLSNGRILSCVPEADVDAEGEMTFKWNSGVDDLHLEMPFVQKLQVNSLLDLLGSLHEAVLAYNADLVCTGMRTGVRSGDIFTNELLGKSAYTINEGVAAISNHINTLQPMEWAQPVEALGLVAKHKLVAHRIEHETVYFQCINLEPAPQTEEQQLRKELEQLRKDHHEVSEIIENATEIIFKLDREGNFLFVSSEFQRSLGHEREKIIGSNFSSIIHPDDLAHTLDAFARIARIDEIVPSISFRVIHAEGYFRWFNCSAIFVFDENNLPLHSIGFAQDITDLKEAVYAIKASEERYANFINQSSQAIWMIEVDHPLSVDLPVDEMIDYYFRYGYLAECNEYMAAMHGFASPDEMRGAPVSSVFTFNQPEKRAHIVDFLRNGFRLINRESIIKDLDGQLRHYLFNVHGIVENGCLVRIWGTQQDITPQRQAEQQSRYLAQVVQNVSDAIISTDLNFVVNAWNRSAEELYQQPAEDVLGKPIRNIVRHEYVNCSREEVLAHMLLHEHWEGETYADRKDGSRVYLLSSLAFVKNESGERIGFAGIHKDITATRSAAEALKISEERYRSLVDALGEGIVLMDRSGEILACNKSALEILQISLPSNHKGIVNSYECCREDGSDFPFEEQPARMTLKTGVSYKGIVMGLRRPDKSFCWISINSEPVYYSGGKHLPDAVVASFIDITEAKRAKMELEQSEIRLRDFSDKITNILNSITDGFIAVDRNMKVLLWNRIIENFTGIRSAEAVGRNIRELFPGLVESHILTRYHEAMTEGKTVTHEHCFERTGTWFETSAYPSSEGLFVYFRDISERKEQERIIALEREVLEVNALPEQSLKSTINYYLRKLEQMFPGLICCVVGLKPNRRMITTIAAPSMDPAFSIAIEGEEIGPNVGSCGTAMFYKRQVISTDIERDPLWAKYRDLALRFNLRSCWSFPILNAANEVEATLAIYHRYPKSPAPKDINFFEREAKLLGIIIANKKAEEKIRVSYERYLLAIRATNDVIYDWDLINNQLHWAESFYSHFGYQPSDPSIAYEQWENAIHPNERTTVLESLRKFLDSGNSVVWQGEYRIRHASGHYLLIQERGFLVYNLKGEATRMVGSIQDVTQKKQMEQRLLKQEVDRQKLVAQAVVDAQEREREEIGKELHDNVNQILSTARLYLELANSDERERSNLIKRSTNTINDAINEIRAISRSLLPPSVGDLGLVESVQDLVENVRFTRKLNVEFYCQGEVDSLVLHQQKLMLFRIIQEQVNNVLKHAEAENLIIELSVDEGELQLTLTDDGKGFDAGDIKKKKGVGLSNIHSRVELFNGIVKIVTSPGDGCTLHIHVPILNP